MVKKPKLSKRPRDNPFTQQNLPAWQPILAPHWVIITFLVIFVAFTPIGIALIFASESVHEIQMEYTNECEQVRDSTTGQPYCLIDKMQFTLDRRMEAPIYMYYKLDNFYQNHRRYVSSRSDSQLGGSSVDASAAEESCSPIWAYAPRGAGASSVSESAIINPCGLIAWSMFNDSISLYKYDDATLTNSSLICSGPRPIGSENPDPNSKCTKSGIAWSSDRNVKFKKPSSSKNRMHPMDYYNETGHTIPSHDDEDFMVWMRTAALPSFRKLYRIIQQDLDPGTYYFHINNRYPVGSFSGKKSVILSTISFLGGENLFLAISYVCVGGICLFLAVGFFVGWMLQLVVQRVKRSRQSVA